MTKDAKGMDVTILDRSFRIACEEDEQADLRKAVDYLDTQMRELRDGGKVVDTERIAILVALNITHELLSLRLAPGFDLGEFKRRMRSMVATIDQAMSHQDNLF